MSVVVKFVYAVKPGRLDDFVAKLGQAASSHFNSPVMPRSVRLFESIVPGPGTNIQLLVEYEDMAAYGVRSKFENENLEWRQLFSEGADSPQRLASVEILSEITPDIPRC